VLFGSAAEGRLRPTSDVNVVVVLRRVDPKRLEAIGEAYRFAHAAIRLSAMFIRESEIAVAKDAFAVKFADIAARHEVLYGTDPFDGLTISREAARHRLLLWLESGVRLAPREALRQIADETGSAAALTGITEARESGGVPAIGAEATLIGAIELATQLAGRIERLG